MHFQQVASLVLASIASVSIATPVSRAADTLEWTDYPHLKGKSGIRFASYVVPMDWDHPTNAGNVTLGITKLPARDSERRIGTLFYNPGGPGGLASQSLVAMFEIPGLIDPEILDRFDLIGLDLRGSGLSDPLKCSSTAYARRAPNVYPTDEAATERLLTRNRKFRQSCLDMTGTPLFDYMDTVSIVKDHEAVRVALGGEKITWWGSSYGTQLGYQYAELFPDVFRAMLFDAVVARAQPSAAIFVEGAAGSDAVFRYFLDWCGKQNATTCPLAHQSKTPEEQWNQLLQKATATSPLELKNTVATAWQALQSPAFPSSSGQGFSYLAGLIHKALKSNSPRSESKIGTATSRYNLSSSYTEIAVSCADQTHPDTSYSDFQYKKFIGQTQAPLLQGYSIQALFQLQCAGLPPPSRNPPRPINIPHSKELPIIFMTGNTLDPAANPVMATIVRDEIGKHRARYCPRIGVGHTVYAQPDAVHGEARKAMNKYLLELELPEEGTIFQS